MFLAARGRQTEAALGCQIFFGEFKSIVEVGLDDVPERRRRTEAAIRCQIRLFEHRSRWRLVWMAYGSPMHRPPKGEQADQGGGKAPDFFLLGCKPMLKDDWVTYRSLGRVGRSKQW